jgi:hypothetical protein
MAQRLISITLSGKVGYSDSSSAANVQFAQTKHSIAAFSQDLRLSQLVFIPKTNDYTLSKFAALAA